MPPKKISLLIINAAEYGGSITFSETRPLYFTHSQPLKGGAAENNYVLSIILLHQD
jgi:hypothetical protein